METNKPICRECRHSRDLPGLRHISCDKRSAKVTGDSLGIRKGWFNHPHNFDPLFLITCDGFEEINRKKQTKDKESEQKKMTSEEFLKLSTFICDKLDKQHTEFEEQKERLDKVEEQLKALYQLVKDRNAICI